MKAPRHWTPNGRFINRIREIWTISSVESKLFITFILFAVSFQVRFIWLVATTGTVPTWMWVVGGITFFVVFMIRLMHGIRQ